MSRAIDGHGFFSTTDGLDIRVVLGIVMSGDGPPRVEIASIHDPSDLISVDAVDRAAKSLLFEVTRQLRRKAYRERPFQSDPKPKDRSAQKKRIRSVVEAFQQEQQRYPKGSRRADRRA